MASGFGTSSSFPADFKEQVRSRTDLVALVNETVPLTPRGPHDYVGLCPFHDDHNPSFHVYPDRQVYRCWVCDEGGDCFSFLMKADRLGFREALEVLAERAHLELPKSGPERSPESKNRQARLLEIVAWAEQLLHRCLVSDKLAGPAREYLQSRQISAESITRFRLGFHPENWSWLLDQAGFRQFTSQELFQARLVRERKEGNGFYDDFVGRVTFPIHDLRARPVAFGGRILPGQQREDAQKYLNSPESELFTKSKLVYGFEQARDRIRKTETVVVMEGYTDVILAHQHGLTNAVATLGTSLTESHVGLFKRFARKVVLVYDGDEAGQKAAGRACDKFLAQEVDLRILTLPGGLDPADYLAQTGLASFQQLVDEATEGWEHKLQLCVKEFGVDSVDARQRTLDSLLELMARTPQLAGSSRETLLVSRLARRLLIDEQAVQQRLNDLRKGRPVPKFHEVATSETTPATEGRPNPTLDLKNPGDLVEAELLEIVLAAPRLIEVLQTKVSAEELRNPLLKTLLQLCYDLWERDEEPTFSRIMAELEDPDLKRVATRLDDLAKEKKIEQFLSQEKTAGSAGGVGYLDEAIRRLKLSQERQTYESLKGALVRTETKAKPPSATDGPPTGTLKQEQFRFLSQAQKFHAKRANS